MHFDTVRFAGIDIIVVRPPAEVRIPHRTVARAHFLVDKQQCFTALPELWYKAVYNRNTSISWIGSCKSTAVKIDEDVLQHIKMYEVGVSAKSAERHSKNVEEQVIRLHSIYSASKTKNNAILLEL